MSGECDKCDENYLDCECSKYHFWKDNDLEIRTCVECKISQFKSPEDGHWILYLTQERINWAYDQILKYDNTSLHCKICSGLNNAKEYIIPKCNWCNECEVVRECGPNYICQECEKKERKEGRSLIFTSPVRSAYFKIDNQEEFCTVCKNEFVSCVCL